MIRVDVKEITDREWGYEDADGFLEVVTYVNNEVLKIRNSDSSELYLYIEDVPNMTKALQAAYDYSQTKVGGGSV